MKLFDFGFPKKQELNPSLEDKGKVSSHSYPIPQDIPKNDYLELEKRVSVLEIKLFELRTLLLEQDYKKQNKLSPMGRRVKRFSI